MGSTQPNQTYVGWVGLNFLTHRSELGQKIPSTPPDLTQLTWVGLGRIEPMGLTNYYYYY